MGDPLALPTGPVIDIVGRVTSTADPVDPTAGGLGRVDGVALRTVSTGMCLAVPDPSVRRDEGVRKRRIWNAVAR